MYKLLFDDIYRRAVIQAMNIVIGLGEGNIKPLQDYLDLQVAKMKKPYTNAASTGAGIAAEAISFMRKGPLFKSSFLVDDAKILKALVESSSPSNNTDLPFEIVISEDQARALRRVLECFTRLTTGQLSIAIEAFEDDFMNAYSDHDEAFDAIESATELDDKYRRMVTGLDTGYLGVGSKVLAFGPDECYTTYRVITHCLVWHKTPEGDSLSVEFDSPMKYGSSPHLPECYFC